MQKSTGPYILNDDENDIDYDDRFSEELSKLSKNPRGEKLQVIVDFRIFKLVQSLWKFLTASQSFQHPSKLPNTKSHPAQFIIIRWF